MPGIRGFISEELGLDKEDTNALIQGYSRNNDGHVDPQAIVHDIRTTAENIVDNLPHTADEYDFRHEVTECGKDRQADAIHEISGTDAADSCRGSEYANDTDAWSKAIYDECRVIFEDRAFSDGIEGYRDYVDNLPYSGHTINSVADALGEDRNVVRFIADNGDANDFHNFMIDIRPNGNSYDDPLDTRGSGATTHGCPRELSDRVFETVQGEIEGGDFQYFDRDGLMNGLRKINNDKGLSTDEKSEMQELFVNGHTEAAPFFPSEFLDIVRSDIDNKVEVLQTYVDSDSEVFKGFLSEIAASDVTNKEEVMQAVIEAGDGLAYSEYYDIGIEASGIIGDIVDTYEQFIADAEELAENGMLTTADLVDGALSVAHIESDGNVYITYDNPFEQWTEAVSIDADPKQLITLIDIANQGTLDKIENLFDRINNNDLAGESITIWKDVGDIDDIDRVHIDVLQGTDSTGTYTIYSAREDNTMHASYDHISERGYVQSEEITHDGHINQDTTLENVTYHTFEVRIDIDNDGYLDREMCYIDGKEILDEIKEMTGLYPEDKYSVLRIVTSHECDPDAIERVFSEPVANRDDLDQKLTQADEETEIDHVDKSDEADVQDVSGQEADNLDQPETDRHESPEEIEQNEGTDDTENDEDNTERDENEEDYDYDDDDWDPV